MASVFLQNGTNKSQSGPPKRGASRDCSKGRCLTHASELERLQQTNKLDRKKNRLEEREKKERGKNEAIAKERLQKEKEKQPASAGKNPSPQVQLNGQ